MLMPLHQSMSSLLYEEGVRKAWLADTWRRLRGQRRELVRFDAVATQAHARPRPGRQFEYVPIAQIVGSVGRAQDFTREFLPRPRVNRQRWASVDRAMQAGIQLPPVELHRIGDVYFVDDGHHRVSVARMNGYEGVEAYVTGYDAAVYLTVKDFYQDRWLQSVMPYTKETNMMEHQDYALAKMVHADRLKQAELARLCAALQADRPSLLSRIRLRAGDWLIALGSRLKPPAQPVDAVPMGRL